MSMSRSTPSATAPKVPEATDEPAAVKRWILAHPLPAFFVGAYVFSWTFWSPAAFGVEGIGAVLLFIGVFGPLASATTVAHVTEGSGRRWLRSVMRVRFRPIWLVYAIGVPVAVAVVTSLVFVASGESLDFSLTGERLAAFLPVLAFTFLLNGGPEEPGWRGFALPRLERRLSPLRATATLGALWGLWHLPLLLIEDDPDHGLDPLPFAAIMALTLAGFVLYSIPYTYLWNRTRSAVLCMALHAGFNTSIAIVILRPDDELTGGTYVALAIAQYATLFVLAVAMVAFTRGTLGYRPGDHNQSKDPVVATN